MSPRHTLRFPPFTLASLRADYATGRDPADVIREMYRRIAERGDDGVWIYLPPLEELLAQLPTGRALPLFGVPFAVKDNLDVAGWPITCACPDFSYRAERDASVVARLRAAGAIPLGKANMDQFATGLVGTRTPYGVARSVFDERYISGGSSSGSAVAVAAGLVPFSLGTDTAGSGRVPAAFNNIVGLKPSRGLLSTVGLVPACRSLDCVSVFAGSVADAEEVLAVAAGYDASDPFSREPPATRETPASPLRFGVPSHGQLEFFGDDAAAELFAAAVRRMEALGHRAVQIDFSPFRETARLLYAGPWVAERYAALDPFLQTSAESVHPVIRQIVLGGANYSAADAFRGLYELERLRKLAALEWAKMDVLLLPTTGTTYTVEQVLADPIQLNTNLGTYTNFANLLDLSGLAVPAGFREGSGLPFGITFLATAFSESLLCRLGRQFMKESAAPPEPDNHIALAVVGAHLSGQPLNSQLTSRGARLVRTSATAPQYRLYALANTTPPKPGLVRTSNGAGASCEVEVWSLSPSAFGDFVNQVPSPMVIGSIELEDGRTCKGFLCEPIALEGSEDITHCGGWRNYLSRAPGTSR